MKKLLLTILSIALITLGVSSLVASPLSPSNLEVAAGAPNPVLASPLEQSLSPSNLRSLLLRMVFLYAGFICLLFALEFGTETKKQKAAEV